METNIPKSENDGLATEWVGPGEGSTGMDLYNASWNGTLGAMCRGFSPKHADKKTNLRLTGRPITPYDIQRIAEAEITR